MKNKVFMWNKSSQKISSELFDELTEKVLRAELGIDWQTKELEISVVLCEGDEIKGLNRRYRGRDQKTDVLSFGSDYPAVPQLGDIIIDIEKANEQKGNMSLNYELQRLFLHGLLHLLGYDHISQEQQNRMYAKETCYIKYLKELSNKSG
jgi:probable rRNA maturation factor